MFRPYTPFGLKWEWKQSYYWLPLALFPFTSFLAFAYVGLQMKNRSWILLSLFHFSLISVTLGYMYVKDYAEDPVLFFLMASGFVWINALGNIRSARAEYVKFLYETMDPDKRERLATAERKRREEKAKRSLQQSAPEVVASEEARKRQLERTLYIAREERRHKELDAPIVNVNRATEEELARLPGLNGILARSIMRHRGDGEFHSFTDLVERSGIRVHILEEAEECIVFSDEELTHRTLKEHKQAVENREDVVTVRERGAEVKRGRVVDMERDSFGEVKQDHALERNDVVEEVREYVSEEEKRAGLKQKRTKSGQEHVAAGDHEHVKKEKVLTAKKQAKKETFGRRVDL